MLGRGRPKGRPTIDGVRELSVEEVSVSERGRAPSVKRFRDSHHMVARLFASGLRPGEVAERTGYSLNRISTLYADPAFQDLIANYRESVDFGWRESVDEYFDTVSANRTIAARLIRDKLEDAKPEDVSFRELVTIHADAADRTGYPKRSVAVNVNLDFAAKLDQAIKRSGAVQQALPAPTQEARALGAVGIPEHLHAAPSRPRPQPKLIEGEIIRRRA